MPQGKTKTKAKLPKNAIKTKSKGKAFTRRPNAPIQVKKAKFVESQKLKQIVSKNVNKNVEDEIRGRAQQSKQKVLANLSKAQQAVAKHHTDKE